MEPPAFAPDGHAANRFRDDAPRFGELWERHRKGDREAYEELVDAYLPLVRQVVGRLSINLPSHVCREDLYAAGCAGLVAAVDRFEPGREARFSTYAAIRIRGAVLDDLRAHDFLGRGVRERVRRLEKAAAEFRQDGKDPDPEQMAAAAGLTMDEYWEAELSAMASRRVSLAGVAEEGRDSLEEKLADPRQPAPESSLEFSETVQTVMNLLTPREKQLVVLYYDQGLTLKEVGMVMGVSESRVSQLHTEMTLRLRRKLENMGIRD